MTTNLAKHHATDTTYLHSLRRIRKEGTVREDRTGVGTISLFGKIHDEYDLSESFPIITTKRIHFHSVKEELLWMLSGSTNVRYLKEKNVRIWDEWVKPETAEYKALTLAERAQRLPNQERLVYDFMSARLFSDNQSSCYIENAQLQFLKDVNIPERILIAGELGPVYGSQWRFWNDERTVTQSEFETLAGRGFEVVDKTYGGKLVVSRKIDQIKRIEHQLRNDPFSRRIILSGWNVAMLDEMALPPCHTLAQWYVEVINGIKHLSCKLFMRSNDYFLGGPFNIAQYALLTEMLGYVHGMVPHKLIHSVADAHIYSNHTEQVDLQLEREPKHQKGMLAIIGDFSSILDIRSENISLLDYDSHPAIAAKVAV